MTAPNVDELVRRSRRSERCVQHLETDRPVGVGVDTEIQEFNHRETGEECSAESDAIEEISAMLTVSERGGDHGEVGIAPRSNDVSDFVTTKRRRNRFKTLCP